MKRHGRSQIDQGEVLDNDCYVTSTSRTLCSEGYIITIVFFFRRKLC